MSTSLELTDDKVRRAGDTFERDVLDHYGAAPELVQTDPRDDQAQFDDQRGEQTVTLLQSLGYLEEPAEKTTDTGRFIWKAAEIDAAWALWRQDRLALAFSNDPALTIEIEPETAARAVDHPDRLRRELKACATLEGEVKLTRWPEPGVTTLASRVLLMRLRVYGLCDDIAGVELPARVPLPDRLDEKLLERAVAINEDLHFDAIEIINHVGNVAGTTVILQKELGRRFVVLQSPDAETKLRNVEALDAEGADAIQALNLRNTANADWNRFSLRLLQVRLWTIGYYQGEIDGIWGQHSQNSLEKFLNDYGVENLNRLRGAVQGGWVVIDIVRVLRLFADEVDEAGRELNRKQIDAMLAEPEVQGSDEFWENIADEHRKAAASGIGAPPKAGFVDGDFAIASEENLRRKRYFGWRGVFASFGRFLRKAVTAAAEFVRNVIDAIKKGLRFVRSIARYIVDASRAFVRVAALAVRRVHCWLTGTPVVSRDPASAGIVLTLWQRDFDTINIVGTGTLPELVDRHTRVLDWMQRSVAIMLEIGIEVVRTIVAGLGLWLRFAWQLIRTIRAIIEKAHDPLFSEIMAGTATI